MSLVDVSGICKQQEGEIVLKDISFSQQRRQKIAIAGETGSGKSTLLKIIGGFVQPDEGRVLFENVRVEGPAEKLIPGHPGIAYLSQQFELPNNYYVEEVLEYVNKLGGDEALTLYKICSIDHLLQRRTDQLSGGEKQRIALARLLTTSPKLLLLDEPFSNLDIIHKNILKSVIRDISERLKITCTLISHDPLDILSWADEIIVLKNGQIIQKGSPQQIYHQPVNEYTAALFGNYNLINPSLFQALNNVRSSEINGKKMFIRPESFKIVDKNINSYEAKVREVIFLGSLCEIEVLLLGDRITIKTNDCKIEKGDTIYLSLSLDAIWYI
ncbi:ABC transporter ATP-binding protein [Segetibacter koreensis]|uniref:ABC transporter ATP-binding protein n=1 Tax=Segetibacter koreensis TaxID=398037 RepID=UPI00037DD560|nr:ABC transporter ATP-binding protein [Segetibacter koreensis]